MFCRSSSLRELRSRRSPVALLSFPSTRRVVRDHDGLASTWVHDLLASRLVLSPMLALRAKLGGRTCFVPSPAWRGINWVRRALLESRGTPW